MGDRGEQNGGFGAWAQDLEAELVTDLTESDVASLAAAASAVTAAGAAAATAAGAGAAAATAGISVGKAVAAVALAATIATGIGAAAGVLPDPIQTWIADLAGKVGVDLPRPREVVEIVPPPEVTLPELPGGSPDLPNLPSLPEPGGLQTPLTIPDRLPGP
ncbi:MAG: hypothetical protein KQH83_03510 [Actinobacteria bacterium]|nr:hypothetical protein [Actinomycetota bacterium]